MVPAACAVTPMAGWSPAICGLIRGRLGPVFCINNFAQSPTLPGYNPCAKFQVTPNWIESCDSSRAQSPHAGGIHVCLGDGSVRFVDGGIEDEVWERACDPRDGGPLGAEL